MLLKIADYLQVNFPDQAGNILWSISSEPVVRDALEYESFTDTVLSSATDMNKWRTGNLAVLAIRTTAGCNSLDSPITERPTSFLLDNENPIYESSKMHAMPPATLADAGKIAGELLQIYENTGWSGLLDILGKIEQINDIEKLHLPLICLSGIISEPDELAYQLLKLGESYAILRLAVMIPCHNYFDSYTLLARLSLLITSASPESRIYILYTLAHFGKKDLVLEIAKDLLERSPISLPNLQNDFQQPQGKSDLSNLFYHLCLHQIIGDDQQVEKYTEYITEKVDYLKYGLSIQKMKLSDEVRGLDIGQRLIDEISGKAASFGGILDELFATIYERSLPVRKSNEVESVFNLIIDFEKAREHGQAERCEYLADQIIRLVKSTLREKNYLPTPTFITDYRLNRILDAFITAGYLAHAKRLGEVLFEYFPSDTGVLHSLAELHIQQHDFRSALKFSIFERTYIGDEPELVRRLVNLSERLGDHERALEYLNALKRSSIGITVEEQFQLAQLALKVKQFSYAIEISSALIDLESYQLEALCITGESYLRLANDRAAIDRLKEAKSINPHHPRVYALLAEGYRNQPGEQNIIDLLLNALEILPESATVNVEIAKEYLFKNLVPEALPYLQKAVNLNPDTKEAVISIGTILATLGDLRSAFSYYQNALNILDFDEDVVREVMRISIELDEFGIANRLGDQFLQNAKPTAEDYAQILAARLQGRNPILSDSIELSLEEISTLEELLTQALKLDPEHYQLNLIRAELLAFAGKYSESRIIYMQIVDSSAGDHWRISAGLGFVSLRQKEFNTAIAALLDSYQKAPEKEKLEKYLAEACLGAGLFDDSRRYAENVFERKSNDIDTVVWYASILNKIGDLEPAISALLKAIELKPDRLEIKMQLAEVMYKSGRIDEATQLVNNLRDEEILDRTVLQRMAQLFIRNNEWETAGLVLQQSLDNGEASDVSILFALSLINLISMDYEAAFGFSQQSLEISPENHYLYVQQADLLYLLNKPQAALSCLDYSEQLTSQASGSNSEKEIDHDLIDLLLPREWIKEIKHGDGILIRKILFLKSCDRISEAYHLAQSAYEIYPDQPGLLCLLVELALRSGDFGFARQRLIEANKIKNPKILEHLLNLRLRLNLLENEINDLLELEAIGAMETIISSEVYCANARIKISLDDWELAMEFFGKAVEEIENKKAQVIGYIPGYDPIEEMLKSDPFWVYDTGCQLFKWKEYLPQYLEISNKNPKHYVILFGLIKILVLAGEWIYLSEELEIQAHKPTSGLGDYNLSNLVASLVSRMPEDINIPHLNRLMIRSEILFSTEPLQIKQVNEKLVIPEDIDFLVGLLRREGKFIQAAAVANRLGHHIRAVWQKAMCYKNTDPYKGLSISEKIINSSKQFPISYVVFGQMAEALGEIELASQAFSEAVQLWPDELPWRRHIALLLLQLGDIEGAIGHFEHILELDGQMLDIRLELASLYLEMSFPDKAMKILESIYQSGVQEFDLVLMLGEAHFQLGEYEKAFDFAEKAKELFPVSEQPYILFARICVKMEQYDAALAYGRRALEMNPTDEKILISLSEILEQSGNMEESIQLLEDVIVSDNCSIHLMLEYVRLKRKVSGLRSVLSCLENLKEENSENEQVLSYLAEAHFEGGNLELAKEEALASLKLKEHNPSMKLLLAKVNRSNGHLDLATHYSIEAIKDEPEQVEAYLELALIYMERRELADALGVYKQAIKANPSNYLPYYHAGLLLRETKDYQEAEIMLKRAVALVPEDINIRRQLGAVVALNLVHKAQEEKIVL